MGEVQRFVGQPAGALQVPGHGINQCHMGEDAAGACLVTPLTANQKKLLEPANRHIELVEIAGPKSRHHAEIPRGRVALEAHASFDRFIVRPPSRVELEASDVVEYK